jgi:hypothetical protein
MKEGQSNSEQALVSYLLICKAQTLWMQALEKRTMLLHATIVCKCMFSMANKKQIGFVQKF